MKITFYKSKFCPRCRAAGKSLYALTAQQSDIEIEEVEVLLHPIQSFQAGIRLIPALKGKKGCLSGFFLSQEEISDYIEFQRALAQ